MTPLVSVELICAVFVVALTIRQYIERDDSESAKWLRANSIAMFCWLLIDAAAYLSNLQYFITMLAYTMGNFVMFLFLGYASAYIRERTSLNPWIFRIPQIISLMLVVAVIFEFSAGNIIEYENGIVVAMKSIPSYFSIIQIGLIALTLTVTIIKNKYIGWKAVAFFCLFVLSAIIGVLTISVFGDDYTVAFSAISLMIIATNLQKHKTKLRVENIFSVTTVVLILFLVYQGGAFAKTPTVDIKPDNCYSETLHVITDEDYFPYSFYDEEGNASGHDVELIIMLANEMKMNLDNKFLPWDEAIERTLNGEADILMTCDYSDTFAGVDKLLKSEPISTDGFIVYSKHSIDSISSLYGMKCAVMKNGNVNAQVKMFNLDKHCKSYPNNRAAMIALEKGEVDCAIMRYTVGEAILKELEYRDISGSISIGQSYMCFGISGNNTELQQKVNDAIEIIKLDGGLKMIDDKWLTTFIHTYSLKEVFEASPWMIIIIVVFILLTLLSFLYSMYKRSKEENDNNSRLFALEDNFVSLYDVNLENGEYVSFDRGDFYQRNIREKLVSPTKFFDNMRENVDKVVVEEFRDDVYNIQQKENIIKGLAENDHIDYYYQLITENGPMWTKMRIVYKNAEKKNVVIGIFNVEEEVRVRLESEHKRNMQMAKIAGSRSSYIVNINTGEYQIIKQDDILAEKYGSTEGDFDTSFGAYVDNDIYEKDRNSIKSELNLACFKSRLEKEDEFRIVFRDITQGTPRWSEMLVSKLSDDEMVVGFSDINDEYCEKLVANKLEEEFFSKIFVYLDANDAYGILDGPGGLIGTGNHMPYDEMIDKLVIPLEDDVRNDIIKLKDIDYINRKFEKEDKAEYVYRSSYFGEYQYLNLTQLIIERNDDGTPLILGLGFSFLDEEAKKGLEMQQKITEQSAFTRFFLDPYISAYYVGFDNLSCQVYKRTSEIDQNYPILGNYIKSLNEYIDNEVHPDDRDEMKMIVQPEKMKELLFLQPEYNHNFRIVRNGEERIIKLQVIRGADESHAAFGFRDVTEELRAQQEHQNQLQEALSMAQSANRAKTTFLNNMSHDIRTPMNAIIGYTGLAESHIDNKEQVSNYLGKISQSSNHLLSLINDVLDMSRIESGKMNLDEKPESIPEIIRTLRDIVQADIGAKNQNLFIVADNIKDENVICDKLRLNQVLLNILSNSIKYTGNDGTITMRIVEKEVKNTGYATYEFEIEDNGMGMDEEFLKTIFDPFTRVKSSTVSGIQGTGLGMAITKNIIDMMGGKIDIKSELNKGTKTTITFDFKLYEANKKVTTDEKLKSLKALIVDDDSDVCLSICSMLKEIGVNAQWSTTGKEAIVRTKAADKEKNSFDVYFIDLRIPDMNGVELTRSIRSMSDDAAPIIITTSYDWADIEDEARQAGVTTFVRKPMFISDLRNVLNDCFGEKKQHTNEETEEYDFTDKRVLLVEDNELNREIATELLQEYGFIVETAEDGSIAVEKAKNMEDDYYDLILMDVQMPVMDGYEATRQIRQLNTPVSRTPIIAMTANAFEEDRKTALEAGMDEHIAKPIDIETLKKTLAKFLK